ncbi:acyltransferase family protein [Novosphingobium pokkalii]|uniref:Acyltransferase family protein n=2 Tax=Novosphingobium pokkalii TaxID=1770194 RepID=A0ABV7V2I4_9SPHN|nr:acyltransferase [Novosphingobium pokkalii]GHC89871.1 acyltransferase [Novosphingobium pokkalii]
MTHSRGALSMNAATQDATATGKAHFAVLDGLRGTAALMVVLFHIQGITVLWQGDKVILHHAPLAVDFFFALSGFVIGYAYDDRWGRMSVGQFLRLRLVRLHPLVILGVLLGFASYLLDPWGAPEQAIALSRVVVALVMGLALIPTWPLPSRWTDTHPLNGPCWSLLQEYLGNLAYALVLRHWSTRALGALALVSGAGLAASGLALGSLDQGSYWETLWMAPVRLCFPFVTGLWLYRVRDRLPQVRLGWPLLSAIMVGAMLLPIWPVVGGVKLNGLYEAACVILLFPAMIVAGCHSQAGALSGWLVRVCGRLSYPIYITHFPFLYVWMNYVAKAQPSSTRMLVIGLALVPFLIAVAWAAEAAWDRPIRRWLARRA